MNEPLDRALVYRVFSQALETETGERNEFIAARCHGSPAQEQLVHELLSIALDANMDASGC